MKTKLIYNILLTAGAAVVLSSCNDFLDMTPTDAVSDKIIWSNVINAELAVNNFYEDLATLGSYNDMQCAAGMTEALTDAMKYGSTLFNARCYIPSEIAYGGSTLTPTYVDVYLGSWGRLYSWITNANEALSLLKKYGGSMAQKDQERLEAELRFFRGVYYFELIKKYKQVILYNENMDEYTRNKALSSEADGWEFVYQDLNYAGEHLPEMTAPNARVSSGAAFAYLSRAMLYAERWADAKTAAGKVIDSKKYELESSSELNLPFTVGGKGAIFQYCYDLNGVTQNFDNYYAPGGDRSLDKNDISGGYGTPTQEMVESFELATGGFPDWSAWHNTEGTTENPPYDKLEPRFANTVLYNGASWKGRTIESYVGGVDGYATWKKDPSPDGRSVTGYFLKKLVNEKHSFATNTKSTAPWTSMRYAEVLLNYAEACYHTGDTELALGALEKIRTHAGLPFLRSNGDALISAIRQERKVELAFEGQYYWDMRRWGLAEKQFSNYRVHGLKIVKNADNTFTYYYVECDTEDRHFPAKMLGSFPLPTSELSNNSEVVQFPAWN